MVASVLGFHPQAYRDGKGVTLERAQADFIQRATEFYYRMESAGGAINFHEYYRSPSQQDEYFRSGSSKAKAWESPHQYGLSADYHFQIYGWDVPASWWRYADVVANSVGLETGINWNDANHLQLPGWKQWKKGYFSRLFA